MSFGVGHKCGLDPVFLWLWHGLAATALIQHLAWGLPHATGVALKSRRKKRRKEGRKREREREKERKRISCAVVFG